MFRWLISHIFHSGSEAKVIIMQSALGSEMWSEPIRMRRVVNAEEFFQYTLFKMLSSFCWKLHFEDVDYERIKLGKNQVLEIFIKEK